MYQLTGVIEHRGGMQGGHYTSYIRDADKGGVWYHISDDKVLQVT